MSAFDPDKISIPGGHFIGGRFVDAGSHAIDVACPSDGRRYAGLPIASPEDVDRAVENSWNAFRTSGWARMASQLVRSASTSTVRVTITAATRSATKPSPKASEGGMPRRRPCVERRRNAGGEGGDEGASMAANERRTDGNRRYERC